jgi:hypothetical protein
MLDHRGAVGAVSRGARGASAVLREDASQAHGIMIRFRQYYVGHRAGVSQSARSDGSTSGGQEEIRSIRGSGDGEQGIRRSGIGKS